jgi:hypothetical protein
LALDYWEYWGFIVAKATKPSEQTGKVKFRIVEFEMEGSDSTLHESLKNIAAAFMRNGSAPAPKPVRYDSPRQLEGEGGESSAAEEDQEDGLEVEEAVATPSQKRPSSPRKAASIKPVKVLSDIRLDDVSPTLKEFCAEKKPGNDLAKYLAIAYWFKFYKDIPDLTPDHFYTAYRLMSWPTPKDPAQPIRDLRNTKRGKFGAGKTPGTCTINHIGENSVGGMGAGQ